MILKHERSNLISYFRNERQGVTVMMQKDDMKDQEHMT